MSWTKPRLPWPLRAANAAGAALRAAGVPLVRLDEDSLLRAARSSAGLSDFGDDRFRDGLRRFLHSCEREARLSPMGRVIVRRDTLRLLENRLHIADILHRHPEIEAQPVRAPIFILGLPRTGTSILHELLAQDPANRVPMTWEVMRPWPPPARETYERDPRIAEAEAQLAGVDRILPAFKRMHAMGARLPQECVAITSHEFASFIHHTSFRVPSHQAWLEDLDMRPVYAAHRRFLQILQWRCPAETWVLKSPGHLWALDALLDVYPDARLIQTHRDPLQVIASLTSLVATLRSMASDAVDPFEIGRDWTRRLAAGLEASMSSRDDAGLADDRVFDMDLREFLRDEIAMVKRIYTHFGRSLAPESEARMRGYLSEHSTDKRGVHRYRLADAGLDAEVERRRYKAYQERFGVESEAIP